MDDYHVLSLFRVYWKSQYSEKQQLKDDILIHSISWK